MLRRHYKVSVNGDNFLVELDDGQGPKKSGFYTICCVEAKDPEEAEERAVAMLRSDAKLKKWTRNTKDDPPLLNVEKIEECRLSRRELGKHLGLVFYAVDKELEDDEVTISEIE